MNNFVLSAHAVMPMFLIMAGVVILTPEKNPTPSAIMASMAKYRPKLPFISRSEAVFIFDLIGSPLYVFSIYNVPVFPHALD